MKCLRLLLVLLFLLLLNGYANATQWGLDANGDKIIDTTGGFSTELMSEQGIGVVGLYDLTYGATGVTGSFDELAAGKIGGSVVYSEATDLFYEVTYVLETTGSMSADYDGSGGLINHAFTFDSGTLTFYLDTLSSYTDPTQFNTEGYDNNADGSYMGADDGTQIATFSLTSGDGTLQQSSGDDDNVDIFTLSGSIADGYFYFDYDDDDVVDEDWHDVCDLASNILIQLIINTTNEVYAGTEEASLLKYAEFTEALGNGYLDADVTDSGNVYQAYEIVTTAGSVKAGIVPEPGTMLLLGFGLLGFAGIGRRRA